MAGVNYNDERFKDVESDKKAAISDMEKTYSGMINDTDGYYQAQINASKEWEKKQTQLQQEKTDFAIQEIEQQKAQAKKDYTKEQSGAYTDWQKQSNEYGANAEQQAAQGMTNTGFSESSQVSMYNTYQSRVTAARESYNLAVQNYNNSITEARLQNNSALAEIAYNALQKQLELSLQGFQYKNQLILDQANKKTELENEYYNRYQDVLQQINTENALAEEIRQFNAQMAEEKRQFNALHSSSSSGGSSKKSSSSSKKSSSSSKKSSSSSSSSKIKKSSSSSGIKKTSSSSSGSGGVDMKSIIDLGYGPISAKNLDSKVKKGVVKETTNSKGQLSFKKNNPTSSLLFSKYRF